MYLHPIFRRTEKQIWDQHVILEETLHICQMHTKSRILLSNIITNIIFKLALNEGHLKIAVDTCAL